MTAFLILLGLFVVSLVICLRLPERIQALLAAALAIGIACGIAALAGLERAQGGLVATLLLGGGALVAAVVMRLRPLRPVRVQRTDPVPTGLPKGPNTTEISFSDYEVLDRIGIGGMGSVFRARRRSDGRLVALKVPQEKYLADAKFVKRFYREAEVLRRFNHPNVVRVYDYKADGAEHFIAMEYLEGESLESILEKRQPSFAESAQIVRALADALRHIHSQNIVHRDIKPANVMVLRGAFHEGKLREGGVKLMDFGIAVGKVLTRLTMTGARVGTPIYMAPEQAKGNRVDARSDVYSLGLLFYEMVTGQTAFKGSYEAVVHQQVFEAPKPPKQIRMEVPGRLSDLILHMIEKDPAARPSLDEVIEQIDAGVLTEDDFSDPQALAVSVVERRGTLRLLDLSGRLRQSLADQGAGGLPVAPSALACDEEGRVYAAVAEYRMSGPPPLLIRVFDDRGRELASFGRYGLAEDELLQPVSLALGGGRLYVLDAETNHVVVFEKNGQFVQRFGGRGSGRGRFEKPVTVACDPSGNVYVLDVGGHEVQRFTKEGQYVSRYAFRKDRQSEELRPLDGLGVDAGGAVYIADSQAQKIRRIEPGGQQSIAYVAEALIGESTSNPWLLLVDEAGQLYAARQGGQVLRKYNPSGELIATIDTYAPIQAAAMLKRAKVLA